MEEITMLKTIKKISTFFASFSFLFYLISMFLNRGYFEAIAYDSVFLYQAKQLFAILLLFAAGFCFLCSVMKRLPAEWIVLFAFPAGACLWVFASLVLLLFGISYTFALTSGVLAFCLAAACGTHIWRFRRSASNRRWNIAVPFFLLLFGLACLASSGFVYKFVSYDSYFYFTNYGHTLTIINNFRDIAGNNSYTLTNISQFLPLLNSYTSFWGLDQCFQIQAFLTGNTAVCFCYGLYQYCRHAETDGGLLPLKKVSARTGALLFSALFTLLLLSSTSFITAASWVLANMYCMVYIFMLFLTSFLVSHLQYDKNDSLILIAVWFAALTLLRKDGIIFAAFFLICFCAGELFFKKQLAFCFFPAVLTEAVWLFYVRVVLSAKVAQATFSSIANNKNIFFVCCIIIGSGLYLFFAHDVLKWLEQKIPALTEYIVLFAGMLVLLAASAVLKDLNTIIDNVDFVIRNMFRYPSSWGISGLFFGVLLALSFVSLLKFDYLHFVWSGYALLNLVSYCIVDSKRFWLNWDDSYNRVLLQIVPVFVFIMAVKILPLLQSGKQDRSSES